MLSTADLAGMNDTLNASLPDSCDIIRDTLVSNGAGGQTATPATVATVPCRVNPLTERIRNGELVTARREVSQAQWIVTVPGTAQVEERDRIGWNGKELEVIAVLGPNSWDVGTRIVAAQIDAGAG